MEININFSEECIHNLAFTRALLIKCSIEKLNIDYHQKEKLKKQILKELKETWKSMFPELESQAKKEIFKWRKKLE